MLQSGRAATKLAKPTDLPCSVLISVGSAAFAPMPEARRAAIGTTPNLQFRIMPAILSEETEGWDKHDERGATVRTATQKGQSPASKALILLYFSGPSESITVLGTHVNSQQAAGSPASSLTWVPQS